MPDEQFKSKPEEVSNQKRNTFERSIARKIRIGEILKGIPIMENERFSFLQLDGLKVRRVNIAASIVEKYESEGEKKFIFVKIDDGSGQISLKLFGDDVERLKDFSMGDTIVVIGLLRFFNNEVYVSPETIVTKDPKYLLLRKMEIEKSSKVKSKEDSSIQKPSFSLKERIIEIIKNAEETGGVEINKISTSINESFDKINNELQKLIEEGFVFEPRPGVVRWLG